MYKALITTSNNELVLQNIVEDCVQNKKLSPCAHIITNISSFYEFENKFISDKEYVLIIKCKKENLEAINDIVNDLHNYDVPEIISVKFNIISQKYKEWFDKHGL